MGANEMLLKLIIELMNIYKDPKYTVTSVRGDADAEIADCYLSAGSEYMTYLDTGKRTLSINVDFYLDEGGSIGVY